MAAEGETKPVVAEEAGEKKEQPAATEAGAAAEAKAEEKAEEQQAAEAAPKKAAEPKPTVHKVDFEKDIVYLYQFSRTPLLPSLSPYCLKVETWLRLAGLKYENVDHKTKFRSKKGQLPFVELNGDEIADSTVIIKDLATKFDKDIDATLTAEQKLVAHATISMIENHLTFVHSYWRAKNPDLMLKGYKVNLQHALGTRLPNGILNFIFKIHYGRKLSKKVKAQGLGVHSADEIEEFGRQDLKVLSELLADKPFFFGDEPTTLDCVAFSILAQIHFLSEDVKYGLRDYMAENCPNLIGHVSRIKERCFPDWDDICTKLDLNAHLPKPEPEKKENKEGDNTEKAAEQDKNESELEKDKDKSDEKTEKTENKDKEESK
jgi:glutathione S-transferase